MCLKWWIVQPGCTINRHTSYRVRNVAEVCLARWNRFISTTREQILPFPPHISCFYRNAKKKRKRENKTKGKNMFSPFLLLWLLDGAALDWRESSKLLSSWHNSLFSSTFWLKRERAAKTILALPDHHHTPSVTPRLHKKRGKKPKNKSKSIVSRSGKFQIAHDFHLASCCGWIAACESSGFISCTSPGLSTVSLLSPKLKTLQVNCDYKYETF